MNNKINHNNTINLNSINPNTKVDNNLDNDEESCLKMKGHFLLKKNKFTHRGYLKQLTISETNEDSRKKTKTIKEGFGILTWDDNFKLYGIFEKNDVNGMAKLINPTNTTSFEGQYEKNKPKGYGIYKTTHGYSIEGNWIKNHINDIGIEKWKDGSFYQGEYKNNKKNGIGYYKWKDGTIYEGEFLNDQMNGFGIITYINNNKYEGQFLNGLMNGYGEFTWNNKMKFIGNYVNEIKEGFGIYVWDIISFEVYLGFWKNGKMNGLGVKIKGDIVKYGSWKDGNKEFWLKDSEELINYYKNGTRKKINGELSVYHSNIIKRSITSYDFQNQNVYLDLMVKSVDFLKNFIIGNYFCDKKNVKFI